MNPASNNAQNNSLDDKNKPDSSSRISTPAIGKETESIPVSSKDKITEINNEVEISHEVADAGVKKTGEDSIELPPDITKLGVTPSGASQAVASTTVQPTVNLPIPDEKVFSGLSTNVSYAVHWLSVWCLRKLKKAHLTLRVFHGKIVRVRG